MAAAMSIGCLRHGNYYRLDQLLQTVTHQNRIVTFDFLGRVQTLESVFHMESLGLPIGVDGNETTTGSVARNEHILYKTQNLCA
jgi:hypothetical protein